MPEATKEVLNFLFKFGYEKIFLVYSDGNIKSKKVSEKLGFELYKKK